MENTSSSIESEYIKNLQHQIYFLELEANYLREQTKKSTDLQPLLASEVEYMLRKLWELQTQSDGLQLELKRKQNNLNMLKIEWQQLGDQISALDGDASFNNHIFHTIGRVSVIPLRPPHP